MIRELNGKKPQIAESAFVSEAAYVIGEVEINENCNIWPGAVVRGDIGKVTIGKNTSVEDNSVIHGWGAVSIGSNVVIAHGAVVHCRIIGDLVLIGNNATVLDGTEIGDRCVIAAGSVVAQNTKIPDESFVAGVPALIKGKINQDHLAYLEQSPPFNISVAKMYKEQGL